jgi:3'-phosphoadenosine 5'-phosphosulfate sulfotransferase (PAPS reductase)/FAD synthetase
MTYTTPTDMTTPDLRAYDVILINTSAGKDSLAMLDLVCSLAAEQGVTDRLLAVHCDLGRMEWAGTRSLAAEQCALYGVPLDVIARPQGDLLTHVEQRGKWPSSKARFCTSDHKRDQVTKLITALVNERAQSLPGAGVVRVLSCMGLRAQESPARRKKRAFERNKRASNTKRVVDNWLPIHAWTEAQVWALIHSKSLPYHYAYDLGMPRLSCVFCIFAPKEALLLAGYHNRELLAQYVAVEQRIGHTFKHKQALVTIQDSLASGYVPAKVDGALWQQCA